MKSTGRQLEVTDGPARGRTHRWPDERFPAMPGRSGRFLVFSRWPRGLGQLRGRLHEDAHLLVDPATRLDADYAEVLDNQACPRGQLQHLVAAAEPCNRILFAADQEEAAEVAPVRLKEVGTPILDLSLLLPARPQLDCLAEDLRRLLLAAASRKSETNKEPEIRHLRSLPGGGPARP